MSATIIDGREVGARVRADVARQVAELTDTAGQAPGLATILVGEDPASAIYVANKRKACAEVGIADHHRHLEAGVSQDDVASLIAELNADPDVSGVLLVAAVGLPRLITAEHVKPGAAVIDVGTNRTPEGLRGDVDFDEVVEKAGLITPVPGGVGPMTIAMLLRNTVSAARMQAGIAEPAR